MAVNLTNADSVLKSYYIDAICEHLNNKINPFFAAIKHSTEHVYGKEVRRASVHGLNGGIGAGTEDGSLPLAYGNKYSQMVATLKNLYGTIEISDKAIRASENNSGAFVNILNTEMERLVKSSSFNFARMLYGDGSGILSEMLEDYEDGRYQVSDVSNFFAGMVLQFIDPFGDVMRDIPLMRVKHVDRENSIITVEDYKKNSVAVGSGAFIAVQGSYGNELTGLKAIFSDSETLYGLDRSSNPWLVPYYRDDVGEISENLIQSVLDAIEGDTGNTSNFIVCSFGVRRALQNLFSANRRSVDTMELAGGFKAMSYNGIPIVADRFCPAGTMYLLNTDDFVLHQLCDWQWMEADDGKILRQVPGKPVYSATLVKYAELICSRPAGQAMLTGIVEA